ncbi:MAG: leucine-rich repeat domain-containing protein [Eubacteriales bacterium]|nr:leucine-rich repeat domain-containing protein [Eubacteriales bacterium]
MVYTVENAIFLDDTSLTEVAYPQSGSLCKLDNQKEVTFDTYGVPERACAGYTSVEEIVLTEKVTSLGGYGFLDCSNAKEIVLPSSLSSTEFYSFENSGITHLVIPDGIVSISESFRDCHNLEYVVLPKSVMAIENQAFLGDNGYKTFYKGTDYEWKTIAIDSESSSINRGVYYCSDSEPADDGKYWHYVNNGRAFWTKSSTTNSGDTK